NGQIGGYARVRRTLEARLSDAFYAARRGATDSELLFLLALARIEAGETPDQAVPTVLDDTLALMKRAGVAEPLRFAAALSDGEQVWAFRYSSDNRPPTLYIGESGNGRIVASEPLDGRASGTRNWQAVPPDSWVHLCREGATIRA
ncbi:MAG: hypothetical protein L6Q68_16830, partial [Aquabacterium sp.]|nr:hypothetical protein [Aquabacterium sp.]MCK6434675.1 hypothetical protein [Aquabacterium sp.]